MTIVPALFLCVLIRTTMSENAMKTSCAQPSQSECDASWMPIPNLDRALVGYDLARGNPFATEVIEDPGLRKQIFNATLQNHLGTDGPISFRLESGISARPYPMCHSSFTTKLATNVKSLKKLAMSSSLSGQGFSHEIESDDSETNQFEGSVPSIVNIAWDATDEAAAHAAFFSKVRGVVAVSEAQCITHRVDVSQFLLPNFHPTLVEVLRMMEKQDTETKQFRSFKRFIRDYGTHYLSSAFLGAKISCLTYFTAYERLKHGEKQLLTCADLQARLAFHQSDLPEVNDTDCLFTSRQSQLADLHGLSRRRTVTFGSGPKAKLSDWSNDGLSPIPIKFELTPIVNLFNHENLDQKLNISSKAILSWFLPLYMKYCKVYKVPCSPPTGCGYDDTCALQEVCVTQAGFLGGHRCRAASWADVTNWPQLDGSKKDTSHSASGEASTPTEASPDSSAENRRSDSGPMANTEPEPANVSWFRSRDYDNSGSLNLQELLILHQEKNWYNQRYRVAMEQLLSESDLNGDHAMDMNEFLRLHQKYPWYPEQLSFLIANTDSNAYLSKEELLEASKVSPDMISLQFNARQLDNLVEGVLAIADHNNDKKITFDEFVHMSSDNFVQNFAPTNLKSIFR